MKKPYIILIVISVLAIFLGGFEYRKRIYNKPSREITVGLNKSNKSRNMIEFNRLKVNSQLTIDKLEYIFLFSSTIDQPIRSLIDKEKKNDS